MNDNAPTIDTATGSTQTLKTPRLPVTLVATFIASDLDGDTITYSITSGNGLGNYFLILDNEHRSCDLNRGRSNGDRKRRSEPMADLHRDRCDGERRHRMTSTEATADDRH